MTQEVSRRDFLARLGVTVGTAAAGAAAAAGVPLAAVPLIRKRTRSPRATSRTRRTRSAT